MPASEHRIALPNRYRILRHIADGGMASVWAAQDERLERLVAVKVLSPAFANDDRAKRRFVREARAAARLSDCRHVVTVYDIGEQDGDPFIVMEHFAGGTLADRLRAGVPIPRPLGLRWLREAATALDCAHDHDVVHRDVKPANLLLDERGRLAVGDFGIATVATEGSVTQTGQVLGTAAYISPEQARGLPATAASDRYSLAVVAYELLTGHRPFDADVATAQARAHVEAAVPPASAHGLPGVVDRVLEVGMAKDPGDRPASAAELVEALEDALFAPAAHVPEPPTRIAAPVAAAGSSRRRWPGLAAVGALAAVAAAAIAIAASTGGGGGGGGSSAGSTQASSHKARPAAARHARAKPKHHAARAATKQRPSTQASQPSTSSQASADDPVALNNQGFALIGAGQPAGAVPLLQRSVQAFRRQQRRGEIDYAFALFNLGTALRLSGRPAEAIPYLEERLGVSDFKRGVVEQELASAREEAGVAPAPKGDGQGHGRGHDKSKGRGAALGGAAAGVLD